MAFLVAVVLASIAMMTQPFVQPVSSSISVEADPHSLRTIVEHLATELPARDYRSDGLGEASEYIFGEFAKYGRPEFQIFDVQGTTYRNVLLTIPGRSEDFIVVGAHYDAYLGRPGADDNASGVAGVIELARLLSHETPSTTIVLAAYTLEEPPHYRSPDMGSARHVNALVSSERFPLLMLNLEMIGYFSGEPHSQRYPIPFLSFLWPDAGDFIAVMGRFSDMTALRTIKAAFKGDTVLPVYSLTLPAFVPPIAFSDHRNFWSSGIDALMITDTGFFRNENYHTDYDTADTLDYERMAEVINGTYSALIQFGAMYE